MLRFCLAAALFAGCASSGTPSEASETPTEAPAGPTVGIGEPVRIGVGETATVGGVAVQFVEVTEDSRCPEGVSCVWEGRARVRLVVAEAPTVLTVPHGGAEAPDEPQSAVRDGIRIRLVALHPYPGRASEDAPVEVEVIAEALAGK